MPYHIFTCDLFCAELRTGPLLTYSARRKPLQPRTHGQTSRRRPSPPQRTSPRPDDEGDAEGRRRQTARKWGFWNPIYPHPRLRRHWQEPGEAARVL